MHGYQKRRKIDVNVHVHPKTQSAESSPYLPKSMPHIAIPSPSIFGSLLTEQHPNLHFQSPIPNPPITNKFFSGEEDDKFWRRKFRHNVKFLVKSNAKL
jgi:hypothetical protein